MTETIKDGKMDSDIKSNNIEKKNKKILGKRTKGDFDEDTAAMVDVNSFNKSIKSTDDDLINFMTIFTLGGFRSYLFDILTLLLLYQNESFTIHLRILSLNMI